MVVHVVHVKHVGLANMTPRPVWPQETILALKRFQNGDCIDWSSNKIILRACMPSDEEDTLSGKLLGK